MKSVGTFDSGKELLDLYSEMPLRHSNMYMLISSGQHIKTVKGSLSSSWMNSPIPSLLFPLWQNESLCETIGMKI